MCPCSQAAERRSFEQVAGLERSLQAETEGILLVDTSTPEWNILFQNEAWLRITGMTRGEVSHGKLWHLFSPAGQTQVSADASMPCVCVTSHLYSMLPDCVSQA